ncbi:MAG: DeoR/GlpR family DNA-binding transcription regulator [Candidatus Anaerobiospirillum merdipullorum]|uniref:DeoR/GlpR family DNA-binding transcription regulator n=1 Tax=Candidatus Anaerobiospirillum merdipullorum TaxID=2838450 RepID=A0A9E2KNT9_9GAMM|nr:DeoR/GlpR family DNA-binding transcription regulator [Candidatus Anaerobiospirillum merdipullorum]
MKDHRHKQILDYLKLHNLVTAEELARITGVSDATIRRDLITLDRDGLVYRVHGGVSLNRFVQQQPTTSQKSGQHHAEKSRIGMLAASLVKKGNSLVLDAGTTTLEIAKNLQADNLTVITPDLHIGLFLTNMGRSNVIITGGPTDNKSQSCIGQSCIQMLTSFCPHIVFMACNSFCKDTGVTAPTYEKAQVKQALATLKTRLVLVADSSKYGLSSLYKVCPLELFDVIISDKNLDEQAQAELATLEHTEILLA